MNNVTTLDGTDWKVLEAKSHWLSLASEVGDDGLHWWSASVKWDGCVEIHRAHNVPFGLPDREKNRMAMTSDLHVCDLDEIGRAHV